MPDELPDEVLIELGRLTWSAIHLEDLTDAMCHQVVHKDPRVDQRPIGRKITDAIEALDLWEGQGSEVGQIRDWLDRAQRALQMRNAILHSTPLIRFDEHYRKIGHALGELPKGDRAYYVRPMEVSELREVRAELDAAQEDWLETVRLADQHHPK